jgi:hypothetical protein
MNREQLQYISKANLKPVIQPVLAITDNQYRETTKSKLIELYLSNMSDQNIIHVSNRIRPPSAGVITTRLQPVLPKPAQWGQSGFSNFARPVNVLRNPSINLRLDQRAHTRVRVTRPEDNEFSDDDQIDLNVILSINL